jgi:hypothetical protein
MNRGSSSWKKGWLTARWRWAGLLLILALLRSIDKNMQAWRYGFVLLGGAVLAARDLTVARPRSLAQGRRASRIRNSA